MFCCILHAAYCNHANLLSVGSINATSSSKLSWRRTNDWVGHSWRPSQQQQGQTDTFKVAYISICIDSYLFPLTGTSLQTINPAIDLSNVAWTRSEFEKQRQNATLADGPKNTVQSGRRVGEPNCFFTVNCSLLAMEAHYGWAAVHSGEWQN